MLYCVVFIYDFRVNQYNFSATQPPPNYKLESVGLVMRHGDRQSLEEYYRETLVPDFKLKTAEERALFGKHLNFLRHFEVVKKQMGEPTEALMKDISESLKTAGKHTGRLSPRGALQWMRLGERFKQKYESILNFNDPSTFAVYSTAVKRTYNSLVALLHSMLGPFRACKIPIKIQEKKKFGLVAFCDQPWCRCMYFHDPNERPIKDETKKILKQYEEKATNTELQALRDIETFYVIKASFDYPTFDYFAPHMCYEQYPCRLKKLCDITDAAHVITRKFFEVKALQNQVNGVRNNHVLKLSFVLTRMLALMKNAVTMNKHPRQFDPKFLIFSGHDSTVDPLRQILFGASKDLQEVQTPLAGSIHFEIYTDQNHKVDDPQYGPYFRVLYVGEERTRSLVFCKELKDNLCHWSHFENFVNTEVGGINRLKLAYKERSSNPPQNYKLKAVGLVMRHGDRQTLNEYYGKTMPPDYKLKTIEEKALFAKHLIFLHHFNATKQQMGEPMEELMGDISEFQAFPRYNGLLTPRGALQWIHFGERFRRKYEPILNFNDPNTFAVFTTGVQRTYNSLVALLHGMLGPFRACKIRIKIPDKTKKGKVTFCDQPWCRCGALANKGKTRMSTEMKKIFQHFTNNVTRSEIQALQDIESFFEMRQFTASFSYTTFDQFAPHLCYDQFPCRMKKLCNITEAANIIARKFFEKKSLLELVASLRTAHILKISFILSQMLALMKNAVASKKHPRQFDPKFVVFSGHDSTVEPLKQVLFGPTQNLLDVQTPLAGHVHFEVFINQNHKIGDQQYGPYFRVIYSGEDRTKDVVFCKSLVDNLCHWTYFENFVNEEVGGLNELKLNYTEKCSKYV